MVAVIKCQLRCRKVIDIDNPLGRVWYVTARSIHRWLLWKRVRSGSIKGRFRPVHTEFRSLATVSIWIAMDATTWQIIAFHVGDRSDKSGKALWATIPLVYREQATFHTDQYAVYQGVIPAAQHRAITKKARKTNHIERFNNTLRQRVSRLVRDTLSFSTKLAHHIGAIKYFICHYNLTRRGALPV